MELEKAFDYFWNDENWETVDEFDFGRARVKRLRNQPYLCIELRQDNKQAAKASRIKTICKAKRLYEMADSGLHVTNSTEAVLKIGRES